MPNTTFVLTDLEERKLKEWRENHESKCPVATRRTPAAVGVGATFTFTQTSIGTVVKVRCFCGAEEDITDYDSF